MKKLLSLILALCIIMSLGLAAYAEEEINNSIIRSETAAETEAPSHEEDIALMEKSGVLQLPEESSYVLGTMQMYVDSGNNSGTHAYMRPHAKSSTIDNIFQGSDVRVIAIEDDWACVRYFNKDNEMKAGWVYMENLSENYPGKTYLYGMYGEEYEGLMAVSVHPDVLWSEDDFVDTGTKFSTVCTPWSENPCIGLTIDYQVVGRNGVKQAYGERDIYINGGEGWDYMGSFEVSEDFAPVRCTLRFEEPTVVKAVAVIPADLNSQGFDFRQAVSEMLFIVEE